MPSEPGPPPFSQKPRWRVDKNARVPRATGQGPGLPLRHGYVVDLAIGHCARWRSRTRYPECVTAAQSCSPVAGGMAVSCLRKTQDQFDVVRKSSRHASPCGGGATDGRPRGPNSSPLHLPSRPMAPSPAAVSDLVAPPDAIRKGFDKHLRPCREYDPWPMPRPRTQPRRLAGCITAVARLRPACNEK